MDGFRVPHQENAALSTDARILLCISNESFAAVESGLPASTTIKTRFRPQGKSRGAQDARCNLIVRQKSPPFAAIFTVRPCPMLQAAALWQLIVRSSGRAFVAARGSRRRTSRSAASKLSKASALSATSRDPCQRAASFANHSTQAHGIGPSPLTRNIRALAGRAGGEPRADR